jgi:hypothetical protein
MLIVYTVLLLHFLVLGGHTGQKTMQLARSSQGALTLKVPKGEVSHSLPLPALPPP